jgi:enediyne biosynthesis protein E7
MERAKPKDVRALLAKNGQHGFVDLARRYGRTFRQGSLVVTCEPEAVRALLMDKPHAEVRPPLHKLMAKLPGSNGILFMDGGQWLTRVRAVMPVFDRGHIDRFASSLRETTLAHASRWQQQGRVADLSDAVQQLGAASVLRMGYGLDPDEPLASSLARALVRYKQLTMVPNPRLRLDELVVGPDKLLSLPAIVLRMRGGMADVRQAVKALRAANRPPENGAGWIERLAEAGLSDEELATEVNHLYGAFNAIDFIITAALYELARRKEVRTAVRTELESVLGDRQALAREDHQKLRWTYAFMLEILRRYPVTMGVVRITGAPMDLGGETLPKGTQVMILLYALHHHPDFWDDADQFKPERWFPSFAAKVPFSYVPFLDGSRKCIGRSMAEQQLLIVLTTLVRTVELRVFGEAVLPPFMIPRFAAPIPFIVMKPLRA